MFMIMFMFMFIDWKSLKHLLYIISFLRFKQLSFTERIPKKKSVAVRGELFLNIFELIRNTNAWTAAER